MWQKIIISPRDVQPGDTIMRAVYRKLHPVSPAYLQDVSGLYLPKLEPGNDEPLDLALAYVTWTLPPRRPGDARPLHVYLVHINAANTTARIRDCGYASPEVRTFTINSLPLLPETSPPPRSLAVTSEASRTEPTRSATISTFRLPVLRGSFSMLERARMFSTRRLAKVGSVIIGLLPSVNADEDGVFPQGDWDAIPDEAPATDAEWDAALLMLTASNCRIPSLLRRLTVGYHSLVTACCEEDATFARRLIARNPAYAGCADGAMIAMQAAQFIERNADEWRPIYYSLPEAFQCFALLLDP